MLLFFTLKKKRHIGLDLQESGWAWMGWAALLSFVSRGEF
jgi:hypothetical protein